MANKLLVVENDPKFSKVLPLFFRDTDFEVEIAQDIKRGMSFAQSGRPSLVLLNLDADGNKGWDLARQLKREGATKNIPLILMSAEKDESEIRNDSSLNGWEAYIRKPFVKKAILAKVEEVMAKASSGGAGGEEELEIELDDAFEGIGKASPKQEEEDVILVEDEEAAAEPEARPRPAPPPVEVKEGASEPELRQAIKELERNLQAMQREQERLEKEGKRRESTFQSRMEAKERELRDLEAELEKKNEFTSQLSEQLKSLNDEMMEKDKSFRQDTKQLRSAHEELQEKYGRQTEELDSKKAEAQDLSRSLAAAEQHGTEVEKERDGLQEKVRQLERKVSDLDGAVKDLTGKIAAAREAMERGLNAVK